MNHIVYISIGIVVTLVVVLELIRTKEITSINVVGSLVIVLSVLIWPVTLLYLFGYGIIMSVRQGFWTKKLLNFKKD